MSFITERITKSPKKKDPKKWLKYKYSYLDSSDDCNEYVDATKEEIELDNSVNGTSIFRGKSSKPRTSRQESSQYVEHNIKEGETLQKLSLLYGCSVAELKRANRLLSSQEFYGLNTLRIPIKQYSLLTEILPIAGCSKDVAKSDEQVRTFNVGIGQVLNGNERLEAAAFLERMDKDLERIRESTKSYKDSLEEVTETLMLQQFKPMIEVDERKLKCNGADCGFQWKTLLCVVIIFVLLLPIASIIYLRISNPIPVGNYSVPDAT